jgi:hypothetical protein
VHRSPTNRVQLKASALPTRQVALSFHDALGSGVERASKHPCRERRPLLAVANPSIRPKPDAKWNPSLLHLAKPSSRDKLPVGQALLDRRGIDHIEKLLQQIGVVGRPRPASDRQGAPDNRNRPSIVPPQS